MQLGLSISKRTQKLGAAATAVVAAGALGWFLGAGTETHEAPAVPKEYLYLDAARVNAYLGQLGNGLPAAVKQNLTETQSIDATLPVGTASLGAGKATTEATEQTVTPDESDRLYALLRDLDGPLARDFTHIDLETPNASDELKALPEGSFVELDNARLSSPRFALPVPALAEGYQRFLTGETPVSSEALSSLLANHPIAVRRYLRNFGSNPTVPLRLVVQGHSVGVDRVILPTLLSGLLNSSNLINGNVSILGLVVRQVQHRPAEQSPYDVIDTRYYDAESAVATKRALESRAVPPVVARVLKLPPTQRGLGNLISDAESVAAPGTVVLPIAVFI